MKTCTKCLKTLPIEYFSYKNKSLGKYTEKCKICVSNYSKHHYQSNKQQYRDRCKQTRKRRVKEIRRRIIEYLLQHPCVNCGESDIRCLDFDHIKHKRKSVSELIHSGSTWGPILKEIAKCQVLCSNCHRKKTSRQLGYFKETAVSTVGVR